MTGPVWDGSGVDPWLPERLARDAAVAKAEQSVFAQLWAELSAWLVKVERAVLPGAGLPPEPMAVWAFAPEWTELLKRFLAGTVTDVFGLAFRTIFGPNYRYDQRPGLARHLAAVANRMVRTPDEVFNLVATAVAEGAGRGEGIPELAQRIHRILSVTETELWPNRAVVVARTETLGAMNAGRADAFDAVVTDLGGDFEKMWLATADDRTRASHRAADGQRVPVGTPFLIGADPGLNLAGVQLMQPGDPSGPAHEVIQCLVDPLAPILTAQGPKPVALIRPGDLVVTHRGRLRPVLRLADPRRHTGDVVRIETAAGVLRVTANHPVLTREGWVVAGEVRAGMIVFRAAPVQQRHGLVGGGLRLVDPVVGGSPAAAHLGGEAEQDVGLLGLDNQERPDRPHHVNGLPGSGLPAVHQRPVGVLGGRVAVDQADAGGLVEEAHQALVAVGDHHPGLVVERADGGVEAASLSGATAEGDDALAVDHGSDVRRGDGVHSMMVPAIVVTSSVEAVRDSRLYNFAVAEDESYIAGGIVVHNCRCTTLLVRPGETVDLSNKGWNDW